MKRLIITILTAVLPIMLCAQAQINTKKMKLSDFTVKTTKIVLTGSTFYDVSLQDEVNATWKVSPYEFCSLEEFEQIKGNDDYYFLLTVSGQFRKETEPGIDMLSLVKGGKGDDISDMLEVVTMPLRASEDPSGREMTYLPALLEMIQERALVAMEKDFDPHMGLLSYNGNLNDADGYTFYIAREDICKDFLDNEHDMQRYVKPHMVICDADTCDELFEEAAENAIVSYTIAPSNEVNGSYCYKMLIGCDNHKFYMYKKHRIGRRAGKGLLTEDMRKIAGR